MSRRVEIQGLGDNSVIRLIQEANWMFIIHFIFD